MNCVNNKKHAYLIMAHNNFDQLKQLINLLDNPLNDIYIHIDKKVKRFCENNFSTQYSNLIFVDRIRVNWGGHSQIKCELNLLKSAAPNHYQYYHLLSGVDLPLKTQEEIHFFFKENYPKNYIDFDKKAIDTKSYLSRVKQYYFFQDIIGRNPGLGISILQMIENCFLGIQRRLNIQRKKYIELYKGANWFSITDELVQYVICQEKIIKKQFYYTICADEIFLQSLAMSSPYKDSIINDCLRAIDWERGKPYTYRLDDVELLLDLPKLFARKFDSNIDSAAINKIVEYLS